MLQDDKPILTPDAPVLIGMDFNDGPSRTAIVEKLADGGLVIHEPGELSEEDWKKLAYKREIDQLDKTVRAVKQVGTAFEQIGLAMPNFLDVSVPKSLVSKHAHGKHPSRTQWQKKKSRRKIKAQSRKRNRP